MNVGRYSLAWSIDEILRSRSSLTSRSCSVEFDSQIVHSSTELRAELGGVADIIDTEYAVFVGIEGQWHSVIENMLPSQFEVAGSRLTNAKMQCEQLACRIIDVDIERALWSAILKPQMMRSIDLCKFAATQPAIA
jgi:hypothetical protein